MTSFGTGMSHCICLSECPVLFFDFFFFKVEPFPKCPSALASTQLVNKACIRPKAITPSGNGYNYMCHQLHTLWVEEVYTLYNGNMSKPLLS